MEREIEFDYYKTMELVERLEELSQKVDKIYKNEFKEKNNQLRTKWKSESADTYFSNIVMEDSTLEALSKKIQDVASATKKVANSINNAEKMNVQIANSRTY